MFNQQEIIVASKHHWVMDFSGDEPCTAPVGTKTSLHDVSVFLGDFPINSYGLCLL